MKQKTHSGTKKRVRLTKGGKGKVRVAKPNRNHLLLQKSKDQKKLGLNLRAVESKKFVKKIKRLLVK